MNDSADAAASGWARWLPGLVTLRRYDPSWLRHDIVAGLELGADDYVTKPFIDRELLARARAQMRHRAPDASTTTTTVGDLEIRPSEGVVLKNGSPVQLTKTEFHLLLYLEGRRATGTLEVRSEQGGKVIEGRLLLRNGALATPLVGDPLAPILEWLAPVILSPRIEVRMTYAPPPPVAAEASIRVGALLEEFDRRISGG